MKKTALIAAALAILVGVPTALVWYGAYDVSATDQHFASTYWLLDIGMRRSVVMRARSIEAPPLDDPAKVARGTRLYSEHCAICHGAPGIAPSEFALGLTPSPANLVHTARHWKPAELYWAISEGIKMSGMPAWSYRLSNEEMWSIVALLRVMPGMTPFEYRQHVERTTASGPADVRRSPPATRPGDARRGVTAIHQYACVTCHVIPGIVGSSAPVGPPLAGIGSRTIIAGVLPNTRETMIRWLREPQLIRPQGAMPDLGVSAQDAADIAAYLATL
ncbi:MAG TPA: c-type cytochrome [Casimicrobiaceae bacterium]|nr:c-type cytochrome [Casimicrobiaceae bacterium]